MDALPVRPAMAGFAPQLKEADFSGKTMNYSYFLHEMQNASLFDLYRLRVVISQQLDNPERIEKVKARLRPGMKIEYFDETENRPVQATVLELNRTRLLVQNLSDGKRWSIRFCSVNLDRVVTDIRPAPEQRTLDRTLLHVGDQIGFRDRQNRELYGRIIA